MQVLMNTLCNYTQELIHGNFYLKLNFARIYRVTNETINISK